MHSNGFVAIYSSTATGFYLLVEYFVGIEAVNKHTSDATIAWSIGGVNDSFIIKPGGRPIKRMISTRVNGSPLPVSFWSFVSNTKRRLLVNGKEAISFKPRTMKLYHYVQLDCKSNFFRADYVVIGPWYVTFTIGSFCVSWNQKL